MDRQDIDALLIGALYGELTPADEARLAAHLESHPADRGALDDLQSARRAVRDSRIFELQLDPPQAVSALLLQEAHRRAPKRVADKQDKESWFARFARSFMAHPAMAAAAMLVLVVGVAGTLYMRTGSHHFADETVSQSAPVTDRAAATTPAPATPAEDPAVAQQQEGADMAGSAYNVELDTNVRPEPRPADGKRDTRRLAEAERRQKDAIVVDRPTRQPKELESSRAKKAASTTAKADFADAPDEYSESLGIGRAGATGTGAGGGVAAGPAPSSVATRPAAPPPPAAAPSRATVARDTDKAEAPAQESTLMGWARGQHNRAVTLARGGDCRTAAKVAVDVANKAPDYFSQYMETDRQLKGCQSYITAEREADAERSGRGRAQKRVTSEPAPTTTTK